MWTLSSVWESNVCFVPSSLLLADYFDYLEHVEHLLVLLCRLYLHVTFLGLQFSFFTCLLILSHHVTSPSSLLSHDHITWPLTYSLTMWFSLAVHMTHTDSYLVACILGFTCESVQLGMTPYFVRWLLTSTGTSSIRLESWQLPRCI